MDNDDITMIRQELNTVARECATAIAKAARELAAKPESEVVTGRVALVVFAETIEAQFKP